VLAFFVALLAIAAAPRAYAQINIDQDKTPAHIYSSDCSVCHKSIRGLADGRGPAALTGFLAEHYTSSNSEAAALAAYVLASGGGVGTAAPARDALEPEHARTAPGQSKKREARQPAKPAKPQQAPTATAKLERHPGEARAVEDERKTAEKRKTGEDRKVDRKRRPEAERTAVEESGHPGVRRGSATVGHELNAATPTRRRAKHDVAALPTHAAGAAGAVPASDAIPSATTASPSAATPAPLQPSQAVPPPSDDIPD
jgi:hypothetical protein